ncbi:helix-turn-helix transcriptional regulator [Nostoc sp. UHCC 0870]|uniref:helix-turn-helix transcriptional regulator n=1 Tax=Nostoc sp. UHCC 0870 TaxID=2914041 RepID=UPI001EDFCA1F|nr:AraC family transcriptional regulator [Nostoc sp. UHCC 0870]UKO96925.1 AraC family transcriptional regulator [Nostoc sp. UHCC 0870]
MTFILNESDWDEMRLQASNPDWQDSVSGTFEDVAEITKYIDRDFYFSEVELSPGIWLMLMDCTHHQDLILKAPVHDHTIQIGICLSGFMDCEEVHPVLGGTRGYFSGSGISPAYNCKYQGRVRFTYVDVEIEPEVLKSFLDEEQRNTDHIKQLFKGDDWKVAFYPQVTAKMRFFAQELWNPPLRGAAKRLYLQGKVFELLALFVDTICDDQELVSNASKFKPETIARIHHAQEILTIKFENPPSLSELAQMVGVSDRTLQRGFQTLFQTTVVGYVTQLRLEKAQMLLRHGKHKVADVANLVGYGHLGHFSTAFKRRFGITPSQCLAGNKAVFG